MTFFHATFWRSRLRHWLLKLISNLAPLAACALPAAAAVPPHERQVLVDLFASTSGQQWTTKSNWLDADPCDAVNGWFGIYCDSARAHVTYIALPNNNLRGKLPETLNQLTMLKSVELTSNFLWGPIPSLQGMTALFSFDVRDNLFTGSVPSLAGLTSLAGFDVSDNKLTGPVPAAPPSLWDNSWRLCPTTSTPPRPPTRLGTWPRADNLPSRGRHHAARRILSRSASRPRRAPPVRRATLFPSAAPPLFRSRRPPARW